ncbi:MAG: type IV pilus assembly protein PilM [Culicoidibacterales bacterium]
MKNFDLQTLLNLDLKDLGSYFRGEKVDVSKVKKKPKKKLLKKDLVIIDLGTAWMQIVVGRFDSQNQKFLLKHVFELPMPNGCFDDGKLLNETRIATVIADGLAHRKIKTKDAIISVNSSQIINRDLFIPKVESEELETVIRYELQQYLPINLADYQIRYLLTEEEDEQGKVRVFVSAFPERMLSTYYQLLKQANLNPYSLELPLIALRKLIAFSQINEVEMLSGQTVGFLDLGQENINLSIYHQGKIDFTRLIRSGCQVIDDALRREGLKGEQLLSYKEERLDVSTSEFTSEHPEVKQGVDQLIYEIEKFLQFYRNNNQTKQLELIYIYGGCAQIKGLAAYLEATVKIPVQVITTINNLEIHSKTEQATQITSYINVISSLIRVEE